MTGLSVLTLVKNREAHLQQLVEGLRRSRRPPEELVVVDMSDTPVEIGPTAWPVRVIRLETDGLPLAAARNLAARRAQGDVLVFLDVDCIPGAEVLGALAQAVADTRALVCAEVLYLGPDDARGAWTETDLMRRAAPHPVRPFPASGLMTEPNPGLFWSLAFGVTAAGFQALGGFDEGYTGYGAEDTDFGFKAHATGTPLILMGGAPVFHQHHDVYDPPLQHFDALVRNARLFHTRWGVWPMEGWLDALAARGLVDWSPDRLTVARPPTPAEIQAARLTG